MLPVMVRLPPPLLGGAMVRVRLVALSEREIGPEIVTGLVVFTLMIRLPPELVIAPLSVSALVLEASRVRLLARVSGALMVSMAPLTPPAVIVPVPPPATMFSVPPPLLLLPMSINAGFAELPKFRLPMLTAMGSAMLTGPA